MIVQFNEGGVYLWLSVMPLASIYKYIERNGTGPTLSKDVHSIGNIVNLNNKADCGKMQLSNFDSQ